MYFGIIGLVFIQICSAKICWKECTEDTNIIKSVDFQGCRRRSTYPHKEDFWCEGNKGPPCTLLRGDETMIDISWIDYGHTKLTQAVYWESGFMDIPWVGMDTEACQYVNDGASCPGKGDSQQGGLSKLHFPIEVLMAYPAGTYNLKWKMLDTKEDGSVKEVFCFRFQMRIM